MESVVAPRAHDLLRLPAASADLLPADAPTWARDALRTAPWVVVRRAGAPDALIAVGLRGADRSQRYAWTVAPDLVCETVTPEDLRDVTPARDVPALRAMATVRSIFRPTGIRWGPTGSVGFELATGMPAASPASDLDLAVRTSHATLSQLKVIHRGLAGLDVRADCQVETPMGAIALAELVTSSDDVLVKTPAGPRLVERAAALS